MTPASEGACLIVNADDYGYFDCVSKGILESASRGIVTATGVFANRPALPGARRLASGLRCPGRRRPPQSDGRESPDARHEESAVTLVGSLSGKIFRGHGSHFRSDRDRRPCGASGRRRSSAASNAG